MKLSVIICTHNPREEYLRRVLEGLRAQTLPLNEWELLVVDNCSQSTVAERFNLSWHPRARHIREEELGLTSARLRGIKESSADILIFSDDDTVLAPDYLEQALKIGAAWPFVGVWGGSYFPEFETPLPAWVGKEVWRLTVVEVKEEMWSNLREGFETKPAGAGICIRRQVSLEFAACCHRKASNKDLGRKGTALGAYEDMNFSFCAMDLGLGTGKSPHLRLTHLIPAGRLTLDYFVRQTEGDAASLMMFRAMRGLPITRPKKTTFWGALRWWLHRLIHRVPREQYEIAKAYQRGCEKGWHLVQQLTGAPTKK